jgi:hypothetical protein
VGWRWRFRSVGIEGLGGLLIALAGTDASILMFFLGREMGWLCSLEGDRGNRTSTSAGRFLSRKSLLNVLNVFTYILHFKGK